MATRVRWLGHACLLVETDGQKILIDPFLTGNPAAAVKADDVSADFILISHGHADHVGDALDIARSNSATVTTNYDLGMWLVSKGLQNLNPMNTGGTTDLGGFSVSLVRADHSSGEIGPSRQSLRRIIRAPGEPTVYHMGDTDIFSDMALIAEIYEPRIAMVPIGDRFTMGAATAAMAVKKFFKLDAVIPCHYGSFPIIDATADKFLAAMRGHATKVLVPDKGKAVAV